MLSAVLMVVLVPAPVPDWLHVGLQGHKLVTESSTDWNTVTTDPRSGWISYKSYECDGSHRMIRLTRDSKEIRDLAGDWARAKSGSVSTEIFRGFKVGDSNTKLSDLIGGPTKVVTDGPYKRWRYVWRDVKNGEGVAWMNEYVFRDGRCVEVSFHRDHVPGCGGDVDY